MKTNKIIKNAENNTQLSTSKKIYLLKRQNRTLAKTIHIINVFYYILAILFNFPFQFRIMEMIDEISNISDHFTISIMCMIVYYMMAFAMYYVSAHSLIENIEDKIDSNNNSINMLKYNNQKEMDAIKESVKASKLLSTINDI